MKAYGLVLALCIAHGSAFAQLTLKELNKKPKAGLLLTLKSTDGTNGSAVTWVQNTQKYYTVIAGNAEFPVDVFTSEGMHVQETNATEDLRGIWFNPTYGILEGNTYEFHDIISHDIDPVTGLIVVQEPMVELYELPVAEIQAVLTMNIENNTYVYLNHKESSIGVINGETASEESSIKIKYPTDASEINWTTIAYTGIIGAEYGLLNFVKKQVYLYSSVGGSPVFTLSLPKDAVTFEMFRFSFANNHVWLYDLANRTWTGFNVSKKK